MALVEVNSHAIEYVSILSVTKSGERYDKDLFVA